MSGPALAVRPTAPARGPDLLARARPLMLARAASAGLTFVIPLVLARLLEAGDYGTYKQLVLVATTLQLVLPLGVAQSLYYFLPRAADRRPVLTQTMLYMLGASALAGVGLLLGGPALGRALGNPALSGLALPLALYTAGLVGSYPLEVALTAKGRTGAAALCYLGSDAARTALMCLPVLAGLGLRGLAWGLATWAVGRVAVAVPLVLGGEGGLRFERAALVEQWRYALPFGAAMAVAIPQQYFHQYAVSSMVPAAAFAVYSVGCFQLPVVDLLYTPTSEVLMVRIAELEGQGRLGEARSVFREAFGKLALLFLPMAAFLWVSAPDFIPALFSERYLGSVAIFRVALCSIPLACVPVDGALRARNATRAILASYVAKAVVNVPLVLVGLKVWGIQGAILAWAACEGLGKGLLVSKLPRALEAPLGELVPWRELGQAAGAALLAGAGVLAFRLGLGAGTHVARLVAEVGLYGAGYAAALAAVGGRPLRLVAAVVGRG